MGLTFKIPKRRGGEHVEKNTLPFPPTEKHHVRKLRRQYQNKRSNIAPSLEYDSIIMYKRLEPNQQYTTVMV